MLWIRKRSSMKQNKYKILLVEDEAIIKAIWGGYAQEGSIKKLQVNMANIRRKLGDKPGQQNYIANELGVGYRLNE